MLTLKHVDYVDFAVDSFADSKQSFWMRIMTNTTPCPIFFHGYNS